VAGPLLAPRSSLLASVHFAPLKIIDVSQPLSTAIAVWPGDQRFELSWTLRQDRGDSVNVAALTMSAHTGTHVDAGYHVLANGVRAAELRLVQFIGPAVVVDAVGLSQLDERVLDRFDVEQAKRVLFRTRSSVDPTEFPLDFLAPSVGLARRLVEAGVQLIGSDAPSMDAHDSKTLDAHRVLLEGGTAILENLVLTDVAPGRYTLIALPLKLTEADGSPVRAVLLDGDLTA
jgi:arylformamidase